MNWLESKYISLLSSRLDKFKKRGNVYNFRCVFCGDSKSSKTKARGYFYEKGAKYLYYCHNCNRSPSFVKFLKDYDPILYAEFLTDLLMERNNSLVATQKKQPEKELTNVFESLPTIKDLPPSHYCRRFVERRKIPEEYYSDLFFCQSFKQFTNKLLPNKFETTNNDAPRLIIPLYTPYKDVIGYQGRSLNPTDHVRYITIILKEDMPKIFGLDKVNLNRKYYVTEGPIDSMFLDNSIAITGSDMASALRRLNSSKDNAVLVFDNEPRNKQIIKKMENASKAGFSLVIWPKSIKEKDINDMVLQDIDPIETIKDNTYKGLDADIALVDWKG